MGAEGSMISGIGGFEAGEKIASRHTMSKED